LEADSIFFKHGGWSKLDAVLSLKVVIFARCFTLRRERLYYARICAWKKEQSSGKLKNKHSKNTPRINHLTHENAQLKKKLAQAEAIIDLQKKVSELFGLHIQQHDLNEAN
jgi:hypothetical protein